MGAPLFQVPVVGVVGRETRGGSLLGELRSPRVLRSPANWNVVVLCKNQPHRNSVYLVQGQKYLNEHRRVILWEDKPDNPILEADDEILAHSRVTFRHFCGGGFSACAATRGGDAAGGIPEPCSTEGFAPAKNPDY